MQQYLIGIVEKINNKTIKINVLKKYFNKKLNNFIKKNKNYLIHNPINFNLNIGDIIIAKKICPISKKKNYLFIKKLLK